MKNVLKLNIQKAKLAQSLFGNLSFRSYFKSENILNIFWKYIVPIYFFEERTSTLLLIELNISLKSKIKHL